MPIRFLGFALTAALVAFVVIVTGIALVAFLGRRGAATTWTQWGSIGEAFGVVNSIVSALALAALVFTYAVQSGEIRRQREDLTAHRRILENAEASLRRSAAVDLRKLHVDLIHIATNDPDLAEVWPSHAGTDPIVRRQNMYANLLLQHAWLQYTVGIATHEELISNLRHLFASPKVRSFWRDTAKIRKNVYVDGTAEFDLAATADEIWREYENLLACADDQAADVPIVRPGVVGEAA